MGFSVPRDGQVSGQRVVASDASKPVFWGNPAGQWTPGEAGYDVLCEEELGGLSGVEHRMISRVNEVAIVKYANDTARALGLNEPCICFTLDELHDGDAVAIFISGTESEVPTMVVSLDGHPSLEAFTDSVAHELAHAFQWTQLSQDEWDLDEAEDIAENFCRDARSMGIKRAAKLLARACDLAIKQAYGARNVAALVGELARRVQAARDADQTALLRLFKRNARESMSIKELETLREGQTPWFKALVKKLGIQDKKVEITPKQVEDVDLAVEPRNPVERTLESLFKTKTVPFSAVDTALGRPTRAWIVYMDAGAVDEAFAVFGPKAVAWLHRASSQQMRDMQEQHGHAHPDAGSGTLTIGWVRYTPLSGAALWVEEVQSDVRTIVGARHVLDREGQRIQQEAEDMHKANEEMHRLIKSRLDDVDALLDGLEWLVFRQFVEEHYRTHKIIMPTHQYRAAFPGYTSNPASVYNELPRRARMTKKNVRDVLQVEGLPGGEVWVAAVDGSTTAMLEALAARIEAAAGDVYNRLLGLAKRWASDKAKELFLRRLINQIIIPDFDGGPTNLFSEYNLVDWLGKNEDVLSEFRPYAKYIEWMCKIVGEDDKADRSYKTIMWLKNNLHLLDKVLKGKNVMGLDLDDATFELERFYESIEPEPVVYTFPDGRTFRRLTDLRHIRNEGNAQHNCAGDGRQAYDKYAEENGWDPKAHKGGMYALRGPKNEHLVTVEVGDSGKVRQSLARDNAEPSPDDAAAVNEAVNKLPAFVYRGDLAHDISGGELSSRELPGMDLRQAIIRKKINLSTLSLRGCDLSGLDFSHALLEQTDFRDCKMVGTNLSGANVAHADFGKADLTGVLLDDAQNVAKAYGVDQAIGVDPKVVAWWQANRLKDDGASHVPPGFVGFPAVDGSTTYHGAKVSFQP